MSVNPNRSQYGLGIVQGYANDAAYLSATGSTPKRGDIYYNTTALGLRVYNGTAFTSIGTVTGPALSTDNALVRWDGTTGLVLQNSGTLLSDTGALSLVDSSTLILNQNGTTLWTVQNTTSGIAAAAEYRANSDTAATNQISMGSAAAANTGLGGIAASRGYILNGGAGSTGISIISQASAGSDIRFHTGGTAETMRLSGDGTLNVNGSSGSVSTTPGPGTATIALSKNQTTGEGALVSYGSGGSNFLTFYTNTGGAAATEKGRITNAGNLLLNKTVSGNTMGFDFDPSSNQIKIGQSSSTNQIEISRYSTARGRVTLGSAGDRTADAMTGGTYDELQVKDSTGVTFLYAESANATHGPFLAIGSGDDAFITRPATDTLGFATNNLERGRITASGNLLLGTTTENLGRIQLQGALALNGSSSGQTTFQASATAAGNYTLPAADGTSGFVLTTNGAGVLTWSAAPGAANGLYSVSGTRAAPNNITAAGGITSTANSRQLMFVQGSGGAVDITANPQISAGTTVGQELLLVGRSDTNTILLENGTGLSINGSFLLGEDSVILLFWDGTNWTEISRS